MAKPTRAPARRSRASKTMRRARKPARGSGVAAHRTYTPELLANGRHRYEQTPEPVAAIAADFRIHPGSLRRLAYRLGWVRYNMGPRELPLASRILSQADVLEACAAPSVQTDAADATLVNTVDRLENAVREELATVEAMRARLKGLPRRPREAETTARTLSSLT